MTSITDPATTLEVLGLDADYQVVWRWHLPDGSVTGEHAATEADLEALLAALRDPATPLWPAESCRFCDTDAAVLIRGEAFCHGHALAYSEMEDPS